MSSVRSLLGAVPSVRGRRVLIVLLLGSGLAMSMLHPAGFCVLRRSMNPV